MERAGLKPYWASVPEDEISDRMLDKVRAYYEFLSVTGRLDLYNRSYAYTYRPRSTGARLNPTGDQGELTAFSVNHYRNLLCHLATMTTQQKAAFQPRSTNTDVKSIAQTILAGSLLDYYSREKRLDEVFRQAVWDGLVFGEGFIRLEWDANMGKEYGKTETGAIIYEGDLKYSNYNPRCVVRDVTLTTPRDVDWDILIDYQNRHTLAAKFPDLEDEILNDSSDMLMTSRIANVWSGSSEDNDNVAVYTLVHKPTPALPSGRYTTCLDNGTVMLDGPLPYKHTHIYRVAPDEESGTIFGFTSGFDLLPIQEAIDIMYSTCITNISTFGVQNVLVPKGYDLSVSQLAGSMAVVEYDPKVGKPEALNLTHTPPEVYNFIAQLEKLMEVISGVNSVARGDPQGGLRDSSGAALALIQSQAIQFNQNLQNSFATCLEGVGTGTIQLLQTFAVVPRIAAICGKSNRPLMKEFTGADIADIDRVLVDMGNPLSNTVSGKITLAEQMMKFNLIQNAEQYIQVITTGRLEPITDGPESQLNLIKAENEQLADGIPQTALITDQHAEHITEHCTILASPEVRSGAAGAKIVQETLAHMQQHVNFLQSGSPLLALTKQQPLQPPQAGPAPSNVPQQNVPKMMNPATASGAVHGVALPNMPNPPRGTDSVSADIIKHKIGA